MKKSWISIGLCLILLIGVFSACTKPTEENASGDNSQNNLQQSVQEEEGEYSRILQGILENDYYNLLLSQEKFDGPEFRAHPYAFYEAEGYDVSAIRNGDVYVRTYSFVKETEPNNLYIATYVENSEGNYYTQYVLRYVLTDKEMEDYDMLYANGYIQARFMNNEIAKQKDVEVLGKAKYDIESFEKSLMSSSLHFGGKEYFRKIVCSFREFEPVNEDYIITECYMIPWVEVGYYEEGLIIGYAVSRADRNIFRNDIYYARFLHDPLYEKFISFEKIRASYYDAQNPPVRWHIL